MFLRLFAVKQDGIRHISEVLNALALKAHGVHAVRQHIIQHILCRVQKPAAVVSEIHYQPFHAFALQHIDGRPKLLRRWLVKRGNSHIADMAVQHVIFHGHIFHHPALHIHLDVFVGGLPVHLNGHRRPLFSLDMLAD